MSFTVIDVEQRSEPWFFARAGRVTGSRACDVLAKIKSGEAAARRDYRTQLVVERLTGHPVEDGYQNGDMKRGTELEPEARDVYEARTGNLVELTGFLSHNELLIGCSLDGHLGYFDGIVELKVPRSATHLRYLRDGKLPAEHEAQIMHNLLVSGAAFCDFVSYDPRFPDDLRLFIVRVRADELDLAAYELFLRQFLREVDAEYQAVEALRAKRAEVAV